MGICVQALQKEANFRYSLVRVRDNVESIAFYGGESHEASTIKVPLLYLGDRYPLTARFTLSYSCDCTWSNGPCIHVLLWSYLRPMLWRGSILVELSPLLGGVLWHYS